MSAKRLVLRLELIAVRQELPDADETVQLFSRKWEAEGNGTNIGWWDGEFWRDSSALALIGSQKPTHWCKLPTLSDAKKGGAA